MHVILTGATGYIGSAILPRLVGQGHDVTALVRDDAKVAAVEIAGATGIVADLGDHDNLVTLFGGADAVIHTASPGDATSAAFDRGVASAAIDALGGTGKPYVHTGGCWAYGQGDAIEETDPADPPMISAWRADVEAMVLAADLPVTIVQPGIVYGGASDGGLTGVLTGAPRTDDGRLTTVGDGTQHWTSIHVDDLAALYLAVLEAGSGFGPVLGVSGVNPTVLDLTAAAAGGAGVATEDPAVTRTRLGDALAEALLMDQQATGDKARAIGGWTPVQPTYVEVLRAQAG